MVTEWFLRWQAFCVSCGKINFSILNKHWYSIPIQNILFCWGPSSTTQKPWFPYTALMMTKKLSGMRLGINGSQGQCWAPAHGWDKPQSGSNCWPDPWTLTPDLRAFFVTWFWPLHSVYLTLTHELWVLLTPNLWILCVTWDHKTLRIT